MTEIAKLLDKSNAAIVMRQHLKPVEGDNAVVFPPTFTEIGYNIDELTDADGRVTRNVCLMDSVGSQANRMEPIFKEEPYSDLVPGLAVTIPKTNETIDILDAGHRIADAVVRFSDLSEEIKNAFLAAKDGNATPLAKLAPTSLVFGCWDSRGTGVKLPRIVRATIRALNIRELTRSATYVAASNFKEAGVLDEKDAKAAETASTAKPAKASVAGLANALAIGTPGGVLLDESSELLREAVLSLSALHQLAGPDKNETAKLRNYILGLALVAFTAPQETFLRMGCELTGDPDKPPTWETVQHDGIRHSFNLTHEDAISFAKKAAKNFGIDKPRTATFDARAAKKALEKSKKEE